MKRFTIPDKQLINSIKNKMFNISIFITKSQKQTEFADALSPKKNIEETNFFFECINYSTYLYHFGGCTSAPTLFKITNKLSQKIQDFNSFNFKILNFHWLIL